MTRSIQVKQPELETKRIALLQRESELLKKRQALQEKLLQELSASQGDILKNEVRTSRPGEAFYFRLIHFVSCRNCWTLWMRSKRAAPALTSPYRNRVKLRRNCCSNTNSINRSVVERRICILESIRFIRCPCTCSHRCMLRASATGMWVQQNCL